MCENLYYFKQLEASKQSNVTFVVMMKTYRTE